MNRNSEKKETAKYEKKYSFVFGKTNKIYTFTSAIQ